MKIVVGSDHAGFEYKEYLKKKLKKLGYDVIDVGCFSKDSVDYPIFGMELGHAVVDNDCFGVGVCGSGIGISIAANKVKGVRAVNADRVEHATLSRQHNNANVICFGARLLSKQKVSKLLDIFLHTEFLGDRHIKRVDMLNKGDC